MNPFTSGRETTRKYPTYLNNNDQPMDTGTGSSSRFPNFNQPNHNPPRSFQNVNPVRHEDWRSANQVHNYHGSNDVQVNKRSLNQMGGVSSSGNYRHRQEQPRSLDHGGNYDQSYGVPPRTQENRILTTPRAFQTNANHPMHVSNYVQNDSRPCSSSSSLLLLEPPTPRQNLQTTRPLVASGNGNFSKPAGAGTLKNGATSTQSTSTTKDRKIRTVIGESPQEKVRFLVGTIERAIKWHKLYKDSLCYYEVVGAVISLQEGNIRLQKKMLLRDNKGPILQVLYYQNCYIDIEDFHIDQKLRCVGRMIGYNMLSAVRIKNVAEDDVIYLYLERYCHFGDQAIAKAVKSVPPQ